MKTQIQTIAIVTFAIASLFSCLQGKCLGQSYTFDDNYFQTRLILDDSHDLVRLMKDGDEIEIEIFMFDANMFNSVPDTLDFDLLEDLATEHDKFDVDLDDIPTLVIYLRGGNDIVYTDQDLELKLYIYGDDGDDFVQGGSGDDVLFGGRGADQVFGFGGADTIVGGDVLGYFEDYERDSLMGGSGPDYFIQTRFKVNSWYQTIGLGTRGGTSTATQIWSYFSYDSILDYQSWDDTIMYPLGN